MAYCTQLWIDNIIGTMGGPNPDRIIRTNNTVLTVQNSEVPVKGWPHLSYQRYPLLLLTILLNKEATDKSLYQKQTILLGIERGQRSKTECSKAIDKEEWHQVSERSTRGMMSMAILTTLTLGLINLKKPSIEEMIEPKIRLNEVKLDPQSMGNGQMVCIRLEPLSRLWGHYDRRKWEQMGSYSECKKRRESDLQFMWWIILYRCKCKELEGHAPHLRWWMILYHRNVHLEIRQQVAKGNFNRVDSSSRRESVLRLKWQLALHRCNVNLEIRQKTIKVNLSRLVVSLMTRLNYNRVRKEL